MEDELLKLAVEKAGVTIDIIDGLVKAGWVPVSESRTPYHITVDLRLITKDSEIAVVDSPVFGVDGKPYYAAPYKCPVSVDFGLDDPKDLSEMNPAVYQIVVESIRRLKLTHLFEVAVYRPELYGYVAPCASVCIRGARVRVSSEPVRGRTEFAVMVDDGAFKTPQP
jgi:hypothetical protein